MSQYILILVWIGLTAVAANKLRLKRAELVCGVRVERFPWWFAFVVFVPIIWMAGHRGSFGDTNNYVSIYMNMPNTVTEIPGYIHENITKDAGFYTFIAILKLFIGNSRVFFLTAIAAIQGICVLSVYRKYSCNYICSVFLFLASTDYMSWMFSGIRQFLAVAGIFAATAWMLNKKYVPLLILVLLMSTVHQTALLMIPVILIAQGKAWNWKTLWFIGAVLLSVILVDKFTTLLDTAVAETEQYSHLAGYFTTSHDDGTHPLRAVVYGIPAILAFIGRRQLKSANDPLINLCTNMSIVSLGLYVVSMFTSGVLIGRLPIYTSLYGYILLPWEIKHLFTANSQKFVYFCLIVLYLAFYYYEMHTIWNLL